MLAPGLDLIDELSRNDWHVVWRARRRDDGALLLLKLPCQHPPPALALVLLEREREILRHVTVPGILNARDLTPSAGGPGLVLDDPRGLPLERLHAGRRLDVESCLEVGIRVSRILGHLHRSDLIHRSVSPHSLLIDPVTREVWLWNSSRLLGGSGDTLGAIPLRLEPRALPYFSPEQTGRMNRAVDYRSDLYSLGITLYELLTGSPPFRSADPLELVHAHIARLPPTPSALDPQIPDAVSSIVMKLIAKTAEERYQSARGLQQDLEACARAWKATGSVPAFVLALRDLSDRFVISQRLYGREDEVAALIEAFDQCRDGPVGMTLVTGYSGIGKTALIRELYAPIARERAYFISGKFDQVARDVPYSAFIAAFRQLFQQLCSESNEQVVRWQTRLAEALGSNGGVIAEVIPEIEFILGPQLPPQPLGPAETRNRFRLVFHSFLAALAARDHPLVVFLDDLQWADAATLDLLEPLLTGPALRSMLLIGAYRDNEIDADHPLARTIKALQGVDARLTRITLGPLTPASLARLLCDTLGGQLSDIEPLASLIQQKTDGNPFFVVQFLKTLVQDGLVRFDDNLRRWTYQLERIGSAGFTDNVIDLMTQKIKRIAAESQRALMLASCIGNRFDAPTLATVSERSLEATAASLSAVVAEGLVVRTGAISAAAPDSTFEFLHDRVQQAAYALIPDDQKQLVHLTVGRLLRAACGAEIPDERLFAIVNHFNIGWALVSDPGEQRLLAELNLAAGRKAKASTAYDAASHLLDRGIALSADDRWNSDYALMFALHLEAAECHYLARHFEVAEGLFQRLLTRARTPLDQAQVHALRIVLYENLSHYGAAVASGREGLALFSIALPEEANGAASALEREIVSIDELLGERPIASLIELPEMSDGGVCVVMRILTSLWSSAYINGDQLVARLISAMLVRLSLQHGNTKESAYGYVTHAITIGPARGDYRSAYQWGELALAINERFDDTKGRAKIHQQFHAHVKLWCRPFATCIEHAREARRSGLEAGDLNYAGYGAVTETWPAFLIANDLERFVRDYEPAATLLERLRLADFLTALRVMLSWALALQGRTASPISLSHATFDESAFLAKFEHEPFFRTFFDTATLHLCVTHEETARALEAERRARQGTLAGTIWPVLVDFWGGLALADAFETASLTDRAEYRRQLAASRESLRILAENCPQNYRCFWLLLSAEIDRLSGATDEAERRGREAIAYAREIDNVQQEAIAFERCAKTVRGRSIEAADDLVAGAHRCYRRWGAAAKVRQLEARYPHLAVTVAATAPPQDRPAAYHGPIAVQAAPLDLSTVLGAAHAIAAEIELDALLRTLMRHALENAGAERGLFLRYANGELVVEAEGTAERGSILVHVPLDEVSRVARGVVQYVRKTGQSLVLADAGKDERFRADSYIASARPRSILCTPAFHQGQLAGILYLENNLASDAFTPQHLMVLEVLCAQVAISLENARLYTEVKREARERQRAEERLREITEGTAAATGSDFFRSLVRHLASALDVRYAFVAECRDKTKTRASSVAFWNGTGFGNNFEYDVADTPCRRVIDGALCHYADDVQRLFPLDRDLVELNAKSYLAAPLFDAAGQVIGHLAVLDDKPMPEDQWAISILRIFSARAGAELERVRADQELRAALAEVEALKNRLQDENVYLQEEIRDDHNFDEIIGSSPVLLDALRRIERVAPTDATVLILGETGTGKELVARAIHSRSPRRDRPLVKVNCGAISAGLVESELFGHVKGAFTGAIDKRVGRFELAHGGTLFLDEVSELPLDTQVKLLRVLQEQEFEPVGSSRTVRVDVRMIAASNRDLQEAVRAGRFRADLFFRLNVLPLEIPPLRDRRSDIPQLVTFFLTRFAKRFGKKVDAVARDTMDLLTAYSWPGNVRELQNIIERAVVLSSGPVLKLEHDLMPAAGSQTTAVPPRQNTRDDVTAPPSSTLEDMQRRHILAVLQQTRGVIEGPAGAAAILNLHPNTLRSRMKRLGVQRPSLSS